jgi:hypothetical protein
MSNVGDEEAHFACRSPCCDCKHEVMCDLSSFISSIIDVVDVFGLIKFSCAQSHPFYEVGVYEIVSGSQVHQHSYVSHVRTCTNRNWNLHRMVGSNVHRVTMHCPHPGRWVQAFTKSLSFMRSARIKSLTSSLSPATLMSSKKAVITYNFFGLHP